MQQVTPTIDGAEIKSAQSDSYTMRRRKDVKQTCQKTKQDKESYIPPLLSIHVVVEIDGIWVGGSSWRRFTSGWRAIAALGTRTGRNEANWSASLPLQGRHGIRTVFVLVAALSGRFFPFLGALLASGDSLGCNEVDIGTVEQLIYEGCGDWVEGPHTCTEPGHFS